MEREEFFVDNLGVENLKSMYSMVMENLFILNHSACGDLEIFFN